MDKILINYEFTEAEAVKSIIEITRATAGFSRFLPWFGAAMLAAFTFSLAYEHRFRSETLFPLILGILMVSLPLLIRFAAKRNFEKSPLRGKPIHWEITREQLRNQTAESEAVFNWNMLSEARETKDGFLLFPQPRIAHWLPKHGFQSEDDVSRLRCLIRESRIKFKPR